jgi:hypothetical protein
MTFSIKGELEKIKADVTGKVHGSLNYGPIAAIFTFFQGRATTFAILFAIVGLALVGVGIWGFIHGKDLTSLASFTLSVAALNGSIQAVMFAHSCKEDWASLKQQQLNQQPPVPPVAQ